MPLELRSNLTLYFARHGQTEANVQKRFSGEKDSPLTPLGLEQAGSLLADALLDADVTGPVNLGWGRATSFDDLARIVCTAAGYQPQYKHLASAPRGVHHRVSDPSRMLNHYVPRVTLEEGVRRALAT